MPEDYKEAIMLLRAAYDLLEKQESSCYVLNILEQEVEYDGGTSDGLCLLEDIGNFLDKTGEIKIKDYDSFEAATYDGMTQEEINKAIEAMGPFLPADDEDIPF